MKINILSTKPKTCGIGITNQYTIDGMQPYLKKEGIKIRRVFIDSPFSKNIFYFIRLAYQAGKNCDIIHVHYNHDCFGKFLWFYGFQNLFVYPILKLFRRPIITTFHENPDLSNSGGLKRLLYNILNWAPLRLSDVILVTTEKAKLLLHTHHKVKLNKIDILPLGSFKDVNIMKKQTAKKELDLNRKKVITLFGFIDTNKGHHLILDVLKDLPKSYHFLIAGDTRSKKGMVYKEKLLDIIEAENLADRVTFYGYVRSNQFPLIMGASDVLVYPYSDITSSLALTTAISYKKPILTSNIEPFKIMHNKYQCTEMFDLNSREDMINKLRRLIVSKDAKMRLRHNMELFIKIFDWEKIGKNQVDIYNAIILLHPN